MATFGHSGALTGMAPEGGREAAAPDRSRKIVAYRDTHDDLLVDPRLEMHSEGLHEIVHDPCAADHPAHGNRRGGRFHGCCVPSGYLAM